MRRRRRRPSTREPLLQVALVGLFLVGFQAPGRSQEPHPPPAPEVGETEASVLQLAGRLRDAGRLAEARGLLEALLGDRPGSVAAVELLAEVLEGLDRPEDLLPWAERAVHDAPGETTARLWWIRALVDAGRVDSAQAVAARWLERAPERVAPHLALASVEVAAGRPEVAIAVLRAGRLAAGDDPSVARGLATLFLQEGDWEAAAAEWTRLLVRGSAGTAAVLEALVARSEDTGPALAALWVELARPGIDRRAREAGLTLAFELGDPGRARELLLAAGARSPEPGLLRAYLSEARRHGFWGEAAWAAGRLADAATDPDGRREWRATAADMALRDRDTATARRAFRALAREAPPGTQAHRLAARRLFSLRATQPGEVGGAERIYREFLALYPGDAEVDVAAMAAELALAFARDGRPTEARRVLREAERYRDQGPIERARGLLAFWAGRPAEASAHLRIGVASAGEEPGGRTRWIAMLGALEAADSVEAAVVGRWMGRLFGDPERADATELLASLASLRTGTARPSLLALAADALDRANRPGEARDVRRHLVERHPGAAETPTAMLALGRGLVASDPAEARVWLERLVVEHPESAVSPLARGCLAELAATARSP